MIKELIFRFIKSRDLIKVYHRGCGGVVGYIKDSSKWKRELDNFYFLDGSNPHGPDKVFIPCKKCKRYLKAMGDVVLINQLTNT